MNPTEPTAAQESALWHVRPFSETLSQVWIQDTLLGIDSHFNCALLVKTHNAAVAKLEARIERMRGLLDRATGFISGDFDYLDDEAMAIQLDAEIRAEIGGGE